MYFITNQEDYIVAASKSFMDKIGYRDVCSISLALKNQQIVVLEDDELKVSNVDKPFRYNLIELHSAFGRLNLYHITLKNDILESIEDENIAYLRKIKEGVVKTKDNEFSIPQIHKDSDNRSSKKSFEEMLEEEINKTKTSLQDKDAISEDDENESNIEVVKIVSDNETYEKSRIEIKDYSQIEDSSIKKETEEEVENKDDEVEKKITEEKLVIATEDEKSDNNEVEENIVEEKLIKVTEREEKEEEESEENRDTINKIKSKIFPWSTSKSIDEIELEEETPSGIKIANELKEKAVIKDSKEDIDDKIIDIDEEIENIDEVKEIIPLTQIDTKDESLEETTDNNIVSKELKEEEYKTSTPNNILKQILKVKVESIDLDENARKLSIDKDNYIMLLENYLEELDNYKNDLLQGKKETINMLSDASRLLSLKIVTDKLQSLHNEDTHLEVNELNIIVSLLKDKLNSDLYNEDIEEIEIVDEKKSEKEIDVSIIPREIIDITSSENLLLHIQPQSVDFEPQRASEELNLPITLILEFVEDFIKQSKDHLQQLVKAYNKEDIKTMQTTAHMLKGAASNLRLDSIANILFKIQKESSIDRSGELLKDFVAELKGLEIELDRVESSNEN